MNEERLRRLESEANFVCACAAGRLLTKDDRDFLSALLDRLEFEQYNVRNGYETLGDVPPLTHGKGKW